MKLKYKPNGKNSKQLLLPTSIDIKDPFTVSASIAFDVHMADFTMQLIEFDKQFTESDLSTEESNEDEEHFEIIKESSPLVN